MLSIKLIGSSKQEVGYYTNLGEDYYAGGDEPPGNWWGMGAKKLGLSGTVQADTFRNILEGKSPDGSRPLVQNAGRTNRRAAFDLTFSVPKSVSIARAIAKPEAAKKIDLACEIASSKAFEAVQQLCGTSRRGKAGQRTEQASMVAAVFRHETARGLEGHAPDPNLHYHFVLCNLCAREDGTTGAFDGRKLFRKQMKMALGALFRAELSNQLQKLGLKTHRPKNESDKEVSWFELNDVPKNVVQAFSKRRKQIKEWLHQNGLSGAKAAEKAALSTRQTKGLYTKSELQTAWHTLASKLNYRFPSLEKPKHTQGNSTKQAAQAVSRGLEKVASEQGHFTETGLLRHSAQEAQCHSVSTKEVISAVKNLLKNHPEIVPLKVVGGEGHYTTKEILDIEKRLFESAKRTANCCRYLVSDELLSKVIGQYETLKPEQAEAVRHITTRPGRIQCINGMAGTGKTFLLKVAGETWQSAGYQVIGTALAAKASQGLQEGSGIDSTHIDRLLWEVEKGNRTFTDKTVLVVDEAGMIGTRKMEQLVSLTERANSKLILVGDHRQLQAIDFGAPFRGVAERIGVAELKDITRQRERWARRAVTELAFGRSDSALERFAKRGLLTIAENRDFAIGKLVGDWKQGFLEGTESHIFAGTRLETISINKRCQQELASSGKLEKKSITVGRYEFRVGDKAIVTKNNSALMVKNGTEGRVVGIDIAKSEIQLQIESGVTIRINVELFPHIDLGYCTTTHKGQGQTVESAYVLVGGPMTDRELSYVQGSRARGTTRFYTDKVNGGENIYELANQMKKSRAKDLVHEYLIEAS